MTSRDRNKRAGFFSQETRPDSIGSSKEGHVRPEDHFAGTAYFRPGIGNQQSAIGTRQSVNPQSVIPNPLIRNRRSAIRNHESSTLAPA
jgi:hypothetical protein